MNSFGNAPKQEALLRKLKKLDKQKSAATFAGLLLIPELQGNCHRIETMVHIAVRFASGQGKPQNELISELFSALGESSVGMMEDPSEDLFVMNVLADQRNFRVFPGLFEGAAFYTQRFLELLETTPDSKEFSAIKLSVLALLQLSECVSGRAQLERNSFGGDIPIGTLQTDHLDRLGRLRQMLTFTAQDLKRLGIDRGSLSPFIFDSQLCSSLDGYEAGNSDLERRPLLADRETITLVLPTAVTAALRRYLIEEFEKRGLLESLYRNLGQEYSRCFFEMHHFKSELTFSRSKGLLTASSIKQIDSGRWFHVLAIVDDFVGHHNGGLVGLPDKSALFKETIEERIKQAHSRARGLPGFKAGLSLVVFCGWG